VKFIHVARDGRDAAISYHNHQTATTPARLQQLSEVSLSDPKFKSPYPPPPVDPAEYFHRWVTAEEDMLGDPHVSFFHIETSFWAAKDGSNLLLVHFNDLKIDLEGEMRRIAEFLEIEIAEELWPALVAAASFDGMKKLGDQLLPQADRVWEGGANRFLFKGTIGQWQGVARPEDLALYDAKVKARFSPDLARWVEKGRLG
jgi:aryl sulfotransferase